MPSFEHRRPHSVSGSMPSIRSRVVADLIISLSTGAASAILALVDLVIGSNRAGGNRSEGSTAGFRGVDDSQARSAISQTKAASAESKDTAMRYWLLLVGKLCAVVLSWFSRNGRVSAPR